MPFKMMDPDEWPIQRERQAMGDACSHQKRAGKTGTLGVGHHIDVSEPVACRVENGLDQGHGATDMIQRGLFGYHAAIGLMHVDLGVHGMCQEPVFGTIVERNARLVARTFDSEHSHRLAFCPRAFNASSIAARGDETGPAIWAWGRTFECALRMGA